MRAVRSRFYRNAICGIFAVILLVCGWLTPIHLRGVDIAVIQAAAQKSPPTETPRINAGWLGTVNGSVAPFLIQRENREKALGLLEASQSPAVQELLRCRALTNTVLFPPSSSASGQAFDVAVAICGTLVKDGQLTQAMTDAIQNSATMANRGGDPQPVEEILMDELSLGQRFDWQQLVVFNSRIDNPRTLAVLAATARNAGDQLPSLLFSGGHVAKADGSRPLPFQLQSNRTARFGHDREIRPRRRG